ncbi:hypothetical protein [Psychroserpens mesophilus]|uniref:hypothetical protein n=1 Tax=Psychroserpens mesophilus TaxID=325473 RepID=UPI003D662838
MKILKFFLFAMAIVSFSACSSDDDSNDDQGPVEIVLNNDNLVGTYEIIYYAGSGQTSVTATGGVTVVTETDVYSGDVFTNAMLTFNTDGTYAFSGSYVETYTVTVTGQAPETQQGVVNLDETGTFGFNNANRTITLNGELYNVTFFNETNLNMTNSYEETFQGITETDSFEFRLEKQ